MSLREQLEEIYSSHGYLTPELVVETARPKTHPLHDRVFDRVPKDAAEAWYRHRAHELIQSVKVEYRKADGSLGKIRAFHAVRGDEAPFVYDPLDKVIGDPISAQVLLRQMERDWSDMKHRYETFAEFWELVRKDVA